MYVSVEGQRINVQPLLGVKESQEHSGDAMIAQRGGALLRAAWQDPKGGVPRRAGSPMPEPGQGRGDATCQGQKNGVSVLLIGTVAPANPDVEEACTACLADGRSQRRVMVRTLDREPHLDSGDIGLSCGLDCEQVTHLPMSTRAGDGDGQ